MPNFSRQSLERLRTCDPLLQRLLTEAIKYVDLTVLQGHRSEEEQRRAFADGRSKTDWPNSKHNTIPSRAVDVAPHPIEWPDARTMDKETYARALGRWYMFVGYLRAMADRLGIRVRCGADWDGDFHVKDQNFHDLPHIELMERP